MPLARTRGVVCIVTAAHRLAPGRPIAVQQRAIVDHARAAADAQADLFQIREPDLPAGALLGVTAAAVEAVRGATLRILVNDRLDVGLAAGADGAHLKGAGIPVGDARTIAPPGWLLGVSCHSEAEVIAAGSAGADYVIYGTVFPTSSKAAGHRWAGLEGLAAAVRVARVPVLAIGGIDDAGVREVARVAAGIAAIGWFATTDPRRLAAAVGEARRAFDSTEPLHQN